VIGATPSSNLLRSGPVRRRPRPESRASQGVWSINVLVVEDDAADTSLILKVLRRHPNVTTASASDAPDLVLQQLSEGHLLPDLILLDIHMPRLDGFSFLEALRQIPAMAAIPVVFLTTSGLGKDVVVARNSSASSYLIKPDSYAELQTRLDGVIKRAVSGVWSK
jgi:two-component system chemotaxis response regulator CheY